MEIAEIKAYMKKYKITYAELAEMTGINLTSIKRIFCGKTKRPHLETMVAIEQALGFINTSSVFTAPMGDSLTSEEQRIINQYRALPDKIKKIIREQIEVYSEPNELLPKRNKKV